MNLFGPIFFFLFLVCISCSNKKESVAIIDLDGVNYNIKSGGIGHDVVSNQVNNEKAQHFIVAIIVTNESRKELSFDSTTFLLISKGGQEVPLPTNEEATGITYKAFYNAPIPPGTTKKCLLMFPMREEGSYKLKITAPLSKEQRIVGL